MSKCSFQDLWKILIGHSSFRDPLLIKAEFELCAEQLLNGLDSYKKPNASSLKKLQASKAVKGPSMNFVIELSKYLNLDEEQSLELFESFLSSSYRGSLSELNQRLASEGERQTILQQIRDYYYSERLHLLRCLKQLLGYWQDPEHDYREVYESCLERINKDDDSALLIKSLWRQYEHCVDAEIPSQVQGQSEEGAWLIQLLREQGELLEIILLYYKDYDHVTSDLCVTAKRFQKFGFGRRQHSRVGLVSAAEPLLNHLSHLCSLILVEGVYLEWVEKYKDSPDELAKHHLLNPDHGKSFNELDKVISGWGDQVCHAPIMLAWMAFKFIAFPNKDLEQIKMLGNVALQAGVFEHLHAMLKSPYFSGDWPVASVCKCVVHTLLSLCVSTFNEDSLGDAQMLIAIATETLTHPRLRLEFWNQGTDEGIGILLSSVQESFPLELSPVLSLVHPLAAGENSAQSVFSHLHSLGCLTEAVSSQQLYGCVDPGEEKGTWVLRRPRTLYGNESQRLGQPSFTLPPGTKGIQVGEDIVTWEFEYSAWELLALETCQIFHTAGVGTDPSPNIQVEHVTEIAKLVTQMLKHDWSLAVYLRPITSQYFNIIQAFSPLPNPPVNLLATCLECIAIITANKPSETWAQLGRTGFLPSLSSSYISVRNVSVAPGHYGQLLNVWERPRGTYPVSMAMLDLLLGMSQQSGSLSTNEMLACVVYVMKEMLSSSHSWRYRQPTSRDEIGCKLLHLCHNILEQGQPLADSQSVPVYEYVCYALLHLVGGRILLNTLAIGVDTVNHLYNTRHSSSQPIVQVESLKLAFSIIDLLLQSKVDQTPTPLEQALATQSLKRSVESTNQIHLVAVIASYIHHHDDPHVPAGATNLLVRLSHVAPMSVFACLGQEAVPIRDAFVARLKAHVEDTELKVAILDLVAASVNSQPGMMELFLCVRAQRQEPTSSNKSAYVLESESCLHTILEMMNPKRQGHTPPLSLLQAAMSLLRGLWQGRHDAALIALRSSGHFWENLAKPLFSVVQLPVKDGEDLVHRLAVSSHVMHIVSMEMYYVLKNQMDKDLAEVLKKFGKEEYYCKWTKCLQSLTEGEEPMASDGDHTSTETEVTRGQLELVRAWSSFLLVISTAQESLLQGSPLRVSLLKELLVAIESQLESNSSPTATVVAIATELSMLYTILLRRWSCDLSELDKKTLPSFKRILHLLGRVDPTLSLELSTHLYSGLIQVICKPELLKVSGHFEPRFVLGLVPFIAETLQNHHLYISGDCKYRPDVTAVYLLREVVGSLTSDPVSWLSVLRHHSLITVLVRVMDEHLRLRTDPDFIEASLSFFLALSRSKPGAEVLVVNGVSQSLSISLADALLSMLSTDPTQQKQLHHQWRGLWQLALHLMSSLLDSLGHQFVSHALDFTGANQERLVKALNLYEMLKDLSSLKETSCVCQFLSQLSLYKQKWQFSLPSVHALLLERVVYLTSSSAALLSNRSNLKQVVKNMNASGVLPQEYGPAALLGGAGGRGGGVGRRSSGRARTVSASGSRLDLDDSWVTSSPAFTELQDGVVLTMTSCLAMLRRYTPPLHSMIVEGVLDLAEYPPLFSLSLAPPTLDCTTPPSLAALTTCLSSGLLLLNKLEPHRLGTPYRSPSRSPRAAAVNKKKGDYLLFLEQSVFLLLSQATRYLVDPSVEVHDKQVLKKELANELDHFSAGLLRNFHRKGLPSPKSATPPSRGHLQLLGASVHDSSASSKASSLCFSDSSEQAMFRLADTFTKHFLR